MAERTQAATAFAPLVRRIVRGMLRNPHDAEDAEQETLCLILAHLRDFQDRGSLEGWVRRIATRVSLALLRKRRLWSWLIEDVAAAPVSAPDPDGFRKLYDALDRLSGRERVVFILHYQEELSFADVAAAVGCREGTARNYAFRASTKLRRLLGDLA
ncbi:MAG TPA: sigma-70 family RNA polymerase sigma factor [Planctomycetota bacterium]|nr:sigma-70 family RNA polymerase sigma factor [Planctomycetota bacterium]